MEPKRVLLRRLGTTSFEEVGDVVDISGGTITVRTGAGETEAHQRGRDTLLVPKGSVNHVLRLYADQLPKIFETHPVRVVEQILRDGARPMDAQAIKNKLRECSIPTDQADKTWPAIKKHLDNLDRVEKSPDRRTKYRWIGDASVEGLLDLVTLPQRAPLEPDRGADEPPLPSAAASVAESAESNHRETTPTPGQAPRSEPGPVQTNTPAGRLATILSELGGPPDITTSRQVALRILECATSLKRAKDRELEPLLELEGDDSSLGVALVLARPAATRLLPAAGSPPLEPGYAEAVLSSALSELSRADQQKRRSLARAGATLVDRLISPSDSERLSDALMVRLVCAIPTMLPRASDALLQRATTLLAGRIRQYGREEFAALCRDWDLQALARAVSKLPFQRSGGRSQFVAALNTVAPELASADMWWKEASFDELAEAAVGPLATALSQPPVSERIVAVLVHDAVARASSRRALASIAAAPPELIRHLSGAQFRGALERISRADPIAASWLAALTDAAELETARKRASAAEARITEAGAESERQSAEIERLRDKNARLLEQLQLARQDALSARDAHERQLKLDLLKTLASVATSVMESPGAAADRALQQTVEYVTHREGLTPIGEAGTSVAFDPAMHDPMGQHLEPGTPVTVLRVGYTYSSKLESLVLVKAHVTRG